MQHAKKLGIVVEGRSAVHVLYSSDALPKNGLPSTLVLKLACALHQSGIAFNQHGFGIRVGIEDLGNFRYDPRSDTKIHSSSSHSQAITDPSRTEVVLLA